MIMRTLLFSSAALAFAAGAAGVIVDIDHIEVPQTAFSVYEPDAPELMAIFYQTGYLTIKSAREDGEDRIYNLGFPNYEVRKAFSESLRQIEVATAS